MAKYGSSSIPTSISNDGATFYSSSTGSSLDTHPQYSSSESTGSHLYVPHRGSPRSTVRLPSHLPPLVHFTPQGPSPSTSEPFQLCFISGNISVCYGCRQKYSKPCQPPNDLCVRHKEWRQYFPHGSATAQTKFANVYYHCNIPCLQVSFVPAKHAGDSGTYCHSVASNSHRIFS